MIRTKRDMVLALGWVAGGVAELSYEVYTAFRVYTRVYTSARAGHPAGTPDIWSFVRTLLPTLLPIALLVVGGTGMAFGRRWAWITVLVVSIMWTAFSFFVEGSFFVNVWIRHASEIGTATLVRTVLATVALVALTSWTIVRMFARPKPWQSPLVKGV